MQVFDTYGWVNLPELCMEQPRLSDLLTIKIHILNVTNILIYL